MIVLKEAVSVDVWSCLRSDKPFALTNQSSMIAWFLGKIGWHFYCEKTVVNGSIKKRESCFLLVSNRSHCRFSARSLLPFLALHVWQIWMSFLVHLYKLVFVFLSMQVPHCISIFRNWSYCGPECLLLAGGRGVHLRKLRLLIPVICWLLQQYYYSLEWPIWVFFVYIGWTPQFSIFSMFYKKWQSRITEPQQNNVDYGTMPLRIVCYVFDYNLPQIK